MRRTAREVCVQAIIDGCLGFRASREPTEHPRMRTGELGLGEAIDRMDGVEQEAAKVASAPPNMQFQCVARAL